MYLRIHCEKPGEQQACIYVYKGAEKWHLKYLTGSYGVMIR